MCKKLIIGALSKQHGVRLTTRPSLCQRPPAADLDHKPGSHDPGATFPEIEQRYAELARFVSKVVLNPGAREYDDADRQDLEDLVVRLNGAALAWCAQSGLKAICVTLR